MIKKRGREKRKERVNERIEVDEREIRGTEREAGKRDRGGEREEEKEEKKKKRKRLNAFTSSVLIGQRTAIST